MSLPHTPQILGPRYLVPGVGLALFQTRRERLKLIAYSGHGGTLSPCPCSHTDGVQTGTGCSALLPSISHLAEQPHSVLLAQRPFSNGEITDSVKP